LNVAGLFAEDNAPDGDTKHILELWVAEHRSVVRYLGWKSLVLSHTQFDGSQIQTSELLSRRDDLFYRRAVRHGSVTPLGVTSIPASGVLRGTR
jgi:hypothetical protein